MKHLKKFIKFNESESKPLNFENAFNITDYDISFILSDLVDKYEYISYEINSSDYKSFTIEIFTENPKNILSKEYDELKNKILPNLKQWLDENNLRLEESSFDKDSNRIKINISKIK